MKKYSISFIFLLAMGSFILNAQITDEYQRGPFFLDDGQLHTVTNGSFKGDLRIVDGRIAEIGENLVPSDGDSVIDCRGLHIYPGLIDCGTEIGLFEIGSIGLSRDARELGTFAPHLHALTAVNPASVHIAVTRVGGVSTVLTVPEGGLFPGQAALIDLFGYTPDQMYAGFQGVVFNFPREPVERGSSRDESRRKSYEESMEKLDDFWEEAQLYYQTPDNLRNASLKPQLDALVPVMEGEKKLLVEANRAEDILKAISWLKKRDVKAVLTGVAEGWRVADSIAASGYPVIAAPVLSLPSRSFDRYDAAYTNAAKMHEKGILIALSTNNSENARNLPFHAGFAAAYGMGNEAALEAVTINPARIFGLENEIGSLERGKRANLFITDGDPFEPKTNILGLFIKGWEVPMVSRQSELYEEYLHREPGLKLQPENE